MWGGSRDKEEGNSCKAFDVPEKPSTKRSCCSTEIL